MAAAIAAITSTIEIFLINRCIQKESFILPPKPVLYWFVSSGLFTGGSFLFMFLALSMERVSIIAPLVNSYAVFVLILAPLIARQIEKVTLRKVAGAVLVVAGILLDFSRQRLAWQQNSLVLRELTAHSACRIRGVSVHVICWAR